MMPLRAMTLELLSFPDLLPPCLSELQDNLSGSDVFFKCFTEGEWKDIKVCLFFFF